LNVEYKLGTSLNLKNMKTLKYFILLAGISLLTFCAPKEKHQVKTITEDGYTYEIVTNDPLKLRIYTLENGLKIYLSINKDEPRIQTLIAVKAGSTYDPAETTGLAHYLEHMLFKGSDHIGTLDWDKEELLLNEIEELYEKHRLTDDTLQKRRIYRQIDSVSTLASKFVIANEYDKMISSIGTKATNAFTDKEVTGYMNNISANELEKWLMVERERFSKLVLRLFHTELETVYEEFNRGQDNDNRKIRKELLSGLFKKHQYGTQTTIGTSEHLKNPSMIKIHEYFNTYYVPNNMAICLAGDLDPSKTIALINKHFGDLKPGNVPEFHSIEEEPITGVITKEVYGPDKESVNLAFRFAGTNTDDEKMVEIIDLLLNNNQAGIIDLDLVQQQKVLKAYSSPRFMKYYGYHGFGATPREGQTLEEAKDLLLSCIDKVKKGEFDDWLIEAVINDMLLNRIKQYESKWVAFAYLNAFTHSTDWIDIAGKIDEMSKITKEQIVEFANKHYNENYVVVYKRTGEDTTVTKVDKPSITPIEINREDESAYMTEFKKITSEQLKPVFLNYENEMAQTTLNSGIELKYIKNKTNELFYLDYIIDMGKNHSKKLALAVNYLPYIGTTKYSAPELQQEFYKLGISMDVFTGSKRSYVLINGLEKSMEKGIQLLEHVLAEVKPDQKAYDDYVDGILKQRADNKLSKNQILRGAMSNYGKYGAKSAFTDIISEEELKSIDPKELTDILKELCSYKHLIFYYGQSDINQVKELADKYHRIPEKLKDYPQEVKYAEKDMDKNRVYFVHYDMVQAEVLLISKDVKFNKEFLPFARVFGEYFGSGLSSIVFQEIREAKGLAYSAYSYISTPQYPDESHYVNAYVGTQADKVGEALPAIINLMNDMPEAEMQFNSGRESILKKIESERITKSSIFWSYLRNADKGINYDIRKDIYDKVKTMSLGELKEFFNEHVKGKNYTYLVLANKEEIDLNAFGKYGEVQELTLEEVFGY